VIPALEQALGQTRQAYERGRYSYVDWVSVQRELLDARLAAIDAASTALFNQALIEQLTAEPLAFDATTKPLQR
jgi:cobalt-zinc-cadmium efflux system outer membrane protein